jgi:hypothetical protein
MGDHIMPEIEIDKDLVDAITEFLVATGHRSIFEDIVNGMLMQYRSQNPDLPGEFWEELRTSCRFTDFLADMVTIYAEHYTREEVRGLVDFFKTDLGRKYVSTSPIIAAKTMRIGQELATGLNKAVMEKRCPPPKDIITK